MWELEMSNATLSGKDFHDLAEKFADFSVKHDLRWALKQIGSGLPFLVFKQVLQPLGDEEECAVSGSLEEEEGCDQATVVTSAPTSIDVEYHVVYSESYQVPVLYFNAFHSNGKLLTLDEIWSRVPGLYQERVKHDRWTVITQQVYERGRLGDTSPILEHPILGRPFFQLHPCNTAKLMNRALSGSQSCGNYIVTWLSSVGPLVGLHLPLVFSKLCGGDG